MKSTYIRSQNTSCNKDKKTDFRNKCDTNQSHLTQQTHYKPCFHLHGFALLSAIFILSANHILQNTLHREVYDAQDFSQQKY